jgi:hypothetical protein
LNYRIHETSAGRSSKKEKDSPPSPKAKKTKTNPSISLSLAEQAIRSKPMERMVSCQSWTTGDDKLALEAAVKAVFAGEDLTTAAQKNVSSILIPRQTLDHAMQKETARQDGLIETNKSVDDVLFDCNAKSAIK